MSAYEQSRDRQRTSGEHSRSLGAYFRTRPYRTRSDNFWASYYGMNRALHPMERKAMSVLVNWLNTSLALLLMGLTVLAATSVSAADIKAWEASINSQTKERYIPVELWAGAAWDGKTELKMPPGDSTYHHRRAQYEIKGPMEWTHPLMGQTF